MKRYPSAQLLLLVKLDLAADQDFFVGIAHFAKVQVAYLQVSWPKIQDLCLNHQLKSFHQLVDFALLAFIPPNQVVVRLILVAIIVATKQVVAIIQVAHLQQRAVLVSYPLGVQEELKVQCHKPKVAHYHSQKFYCYSTQLQANQPLVLLALIL